MKPKTDNLRREPGTELQSMSLTLPTEVLELLKRYGIESKRGSGTMSAFLEISAVITLGLLDNPELACDNLVNLFDVFTSDLDTVIENLGVLQKLLYDFPESVT